VKATHPKTVSARACVLGLAALAAVLLFWRLGATTLEGWDEGIYAEVAREMVARGDWLTPSWNFQPWFEKPPLLMWAVAAGYRLGGVSEFWSRAPSALAGIALVILTFATARRLSGPRAAILSALILLSSYLFLFLARHAMADVLVRGLRLLACPGRRLSVVAFGVGGHCVFVSGEGPCRRVHTRGAPRCRVLGR
jgi:4-amino-4-deoxy-L-arabinose transferase-like glycosyltransferase